MSLTPSLPFTPPATRHLADAPCFLLGAVDAGSAACLEAEAAAMGFRRVTVDDFRAALLDELRKLWRPAVFRRETARLRRLWIKLDAGQAISADDQAHLDDLAARTTAISVRLQQLGEEARQYEQVLPEVALILSLEAMAGLDVPFARLAGRTPQPVVRAIEAALEALERRAGAERPLAYFELSQMALLRIQRAAGQPISRPITETSR